MKRKLIAGAAVSLLVGGVLTVGAHAQERGGRGGGDGPRGGGGSTDGGGGGGAQRMERAPSVERSQPRVERRERAEPRQIERNTPRRVEREPQQRERVQRQEQRRDAQRQEQRRDVQRQETRKREAERKQERDRNQARGNDGDRKQVRNIQATTEQRVRVRNEIYREPNVRRLTRREFGGNYTIGARVHRRHHLYHLTPAILVFAPFYRGYDYIVVDDTICIVDPETYVIVDVIPSSLQYAEGPNRAQLGLSAGDMHFVYAAVPKEYRSDVRIRLALGASVPERVDLMRFPGPVIDRVPQLDGFRYIVVEDDVVVVDPADRSVALVITE